ncbi:hypothetical protein P3T76_001150 [Phytophthora citrophthora]|uniref:Uncharacterized protein n=1 Tax=Phytophthora citrophthora TaxID=4793 RepID=A0AAD9GY08_9STRA|nr:hypothetical protein P3T76_001150 [Phytophthora citrophthora]
MAGLLLGVAGCISALELDEDFQIADPFESFSDDNVTKLMDEVVVPASLESGKVVPLPNEIPIQDFKTERQANSLPVRLPYGGALVAIEAAALLVGGATIVVLVLAKAKSRYSTTQYGYDEGMQKHRWV